MTWEWKNALRVKKKYARMFAKDRTVKNLELKRKYWKASVFQFWMTLNTYSNRVRPVKRLNRAVLEHQEHFDSIVPSLACILTKHHGICSGKHLLKSPGNIICKSLIFKMSLDASALKSLCLWCEFQSHLLFIISLQLKTFWQPWNTLVISVISSL